MSYTIRNIRPSVLHIPDTGLRLDSGQTAVVETLSPQMLALLEERALDAVCHDPAPPAPPVPPASMPAAGEKKPGKTTKATEAGDDAR